MPLAASTNQAGEEGPVCTGSERDGKTRGQQGLTEWSLWSSGWGIELTLKEIKRQSEVLGRGKACPVLTYILV